MVVKTSIEDGTNQKDVGVPKLELLNSAAEPSLPHTALYMHITREIISIAKVNCIYALIVGKNSYLTNAHEIANGPASAYSATRAALAQISLSKN